MNATQQMILWLAAIALLAPLVSSTLIIVLTRRVMFQAAGWFATVVMGGAFVCSLIALFAWLGMDDPQPVHGKLPWIPIPGTDPTTETGWLYLGILYDSLTAAMLTMVTGVAMLVHLYSIGYMHGDKRYNWFFAYLSLFSFSMLGIVTANSLIMLFVFWELVGLTSYLLIGFWFERRGPQLACKKAFVMNRIGDAGFLVGFGILFYQLGGKVLLPAATGGSEQNMFEAIQALIVAQGHTITDPPMSLTVAGIGLFCGAIGKSAQFPLHTWLPDAMEGPTPVSSIVHSATMVAAGVYLTGRIYPILTPAAHLFIATIGLITLVMAACMALVMTDIKRVLAYSTLSQLGYMILGLGAGAYAYALFHLITHAFFKCCLFQCSGSVIHAMHHEQDMRHYGGLRKKLPITAACYFVCTLAIAGASIPFTAIGISGFYSKDGIIAGTVNYGSALTGLGAWSKLFYWGPTLVAYLTVFYMARSFALTFLGKPRDPKRHEHAHEAPWTMTVPQIVLASMAVLSGFIGFLALINASGDAMEAAGVTWVQPVIKGDMHDRGFTFVHAALLHGFAWIIALAAGLWMYTPGFTISSKIAALPGVNLLYRWAHNKFYFDALYDVFTVGLGKTIAYIARGIDTFIVDGLVNFAGYFCRWVAFCTGAFDNRVVDGAFDGAASLTQNSGQALRGAHGGRIRGYVLLLFGAAAVVLLMVVTASRFLIGAGGAS